jgi:hypothetical protein
VSKYPKPLPPLRARHHLKKKKKKIQIFFVEITIKVKKGKKQLISLNEQRYLSREIGKTKSVDSIYLVLYMREEGNKKGIRLLFYSFFII